MNCPECGLPHPIENPYCFCKQQDVSMTNTPDMQIATIQITPYSHVQGPVEHTYPNGQVRIRVGEDTHTGLPVGNILSEARAALWAIAVRLSYCPESLEDAQDGIVGAGLIADALSEKIGTPNFASTLKAAQDYNKDAIAKAVAEERDQMEEAINTLLDIWLDNGEVSDLRNSDLADLHATIKSIETVRREAAAIRAGEGE